MRVEVHFGVGTKNEVLLSGDFKLIDLNKIYEEFIKGDGYRLEIYRS